MVVRKLFDFSNLAEQKGVKVSSTQVNFGNGLRISKDYLTLILASKGLLEKLRPMTVRQCYYALFSNGWVNNSDRDYRQVVNALVQGRQYGFIPWTWIEDRTRRPRVIGQWSNLREFLTAVKSSYTRNLWDNQTEVYFEFWVEKDALSGIFSDILDQYGVTLNVGRGYDGWSSIKAASDRFKRMGDGKETKVFYYGDFDPSGEDMVRSLRERLSECGVNPVISKLAISKDDIETYNLPPEPGKRSDSRSEGFIAEHGELIQVELDALPVDVLRQRIERNIRDTLNMDAYAERQVKEERETERLVWVINQFERDEDDSGGEDE